MAVKKSYKLWLIAIIVIVIAVLIIDWLINRNRAQTNDRDKNSIQNGVNK